MTKVQFGWVIQPVPKSNEDKAKLFSDNDRFLESVKGYFTSAWVEDHFQWDDRPTLECWTTLSYLAARFPSYTWGTLVLGQAYRNPALLAKMAATLQWLTGGRLVLGIGAGWKEDEHHAYGWRMSPPATRLEELAEAVQIVRTLWRNSPATFHGKHYRIEKAYSEPLPNPPIPLMLGTSGERFGLRLVAEYADWWNGSFLSVEEYQHKLEVLARHSAEVGRDEREIVKSLYAFVSLSEAPERLIQRGDDLYVVKGSADQVTAELEKFISLGVQHIMIRFLDFPGTEGLDLFLNKVLPRLSMSKGQA